MKNETSVLLLSMVITVAMVLGGLWWLQKSQIITLPFPEETEEDEPRAKVTPKTTNIKPEIIIAEHLSAGDRTLISTEVTPAKQAAVKAFASGNYGKAASLLEASLKAKKNDPEALIYLNNARIGTSKSYTIAISIPIGVEVNAAKEMLRGVAQAQQEINATGGINNVPLKVLIANDDNDTKVAKKIAKAFVDNPDVLGVIGHFSSEVTLAAAEVYQENQLVVISPTSTSVTISRLGNYVFRTIPSDRFFGSALSRYMLNQLNVRKAAVFFNSQSNYSQSLADAFTTALFADGGEVVGEFDFAKPNFNAGVDVKQAIEKGAEVLILAPNSATLNQALLVVQVNDGRLPMLAGDSVYKPKTLQIGGRDAASMVLAVPWHILGAPNSPFPQAATKLWGSDVNWRTALTYDATQALIAALKQQQSRSGVQKALSGSGFQPQGVSSKIRFLPSGDRNQAVQLVKIEAGNRSSFGYDFVPIPSK
ncbi:ABC transporter substrate-binding protein [Moorena sp. SIO3I6]|uniref:ABC transporter substrate-binding protein n=1 Tax=Moorena sp. SIO3I6 TaxID=2607831 RepID=UPI0025FA1235|nr:ABC transporter substrate-binding protein [Moorena sp. SIO3I6]